VDVARGGSGWRGAEQTVGTHREHRHTRQQAEAAEAHLWKGEVWMERCGWIGVHGVRRERYEGSSPRRHLAHGAAVEAVAAQRDDRVARRDATCHVARRRMSDKSSQGRSRQVKSRYERERRVKSSHVKLPGGPPLTLTSSMRSP
jgi:hypothetical protein